MVSDLMQTHLAAQSNKLNGIMKTLAMVSTVILPMSLISGIYGMNFKNMPELEWHYGYYMALGLMVVVAARRWASSTGRSGFREGRPPRRGRFGPGLGGRFGGWATGEARILRGQARVAATQSMYATRLRSW